MLKFLIRCTMSNSIHVKNALFILRKRKRRMRKNGLRVDASTKCMAISNNKCITINKLESVYKLIEIGNKI